MFVLHLLPGQVPEPATAAGWVELLQTTGGWGLSVILMAVIVQMWRTIQAKDERIFTLLDKQNEVLKLLDKIDDRPRGSA